MLANANHQAVVVDAVEELLQIDIHHPAVSLSDRGLGATRFDTEKRGLFGVGLTVGLDDSSRIFAATTSIST